MKLDFTTLSVSIERHRLKAINYLVFPVLSLPDEILLDIAQKLRLKARRYLMQSCRKLWWLLKDRRVKGLDCRVPAWIQCLFKQADNDLQLTFHVQRGAGGVSYRVRKEVMIITPGTTDVPLGVQEFVEQLSAYLRCQTIDVFVDNMTESGAPTAFITPAIAAFCELAQKSFAVQLVSPLFLFAHEEHRQRTAKLLLDTNYSISLLVTDNDPFSRNRPTVRPRTEITTFMKAEAEKRGVQVVLEETGPEAEFIFGLDVSDDVKSLNICGVSIERHRLKAINYLVFPVLSLPDEILLDIAQKLRLKARRYLMQSCRKLWWLLKDRRVKGLDCRVPAWIQCLFKQVDNDLQLTFHVQRGAGGVSYRVRKEVMIITPGTTDVPLGVQEFVEQLSAYLRCQTIDVFVDNITESGAPTAFITPAIAAFGELAQKSFAVKLVSPLFLFAHEEHKQRIATLLLDTNYSISLLVTDNDPFSRNRPTVRPRTEITTFMKAEAERRGVQVVLEETGPEAEFIFGLDVSDDVKSLNICGGSLL